MFQNQVFRTGITRLLVLIMTLGFAVSSEAMRPNKRARPESADGAAVAVLVAALQMAQNMAPGVLERIVAQAAEIAPEGLRNLVAHLNPVAAAAAAADPEPEHNHALAPEALAPVLHTPSRPAPSSRRTTQSTPGGSLFREDEETGVVVKISPEAVKARSVGYVACAGTADFERYDLQNRFLADEEINQMFLQLVEELAALGILNDRFYIGRAKNPAERGLKGHFSDAVHKEAQRKAAGFRDICDEGEVPTVHHLFRNAHPDQLPFLEDLAILMTGATTRPTGLNSRGPSERAIEYYRQHLKPHLADALSRGDRRKKKRGQEVLAIPFLLEDTCSEGKSPSSSEREDDEDDDSGFRGSPDFIACESY